LHITVANLAVKKGSFFKQYFAGLFFWGGGGIGRIFIKSGGRVKGPKIWRAGKSALALHIWETTVSIF
jgi:hypothetical protein